jgi:short-subunit dehydrogenase
MKKVTNKIKYALITGATSGIGYELARQAAKNGYNLILVARDGEELARVAKKFSEYSIEVKTLQKDLFRENAAAEIHEEVHSLGISPDILINDAGQGEYGKFTEADLERNIDIIRLNIISLTALTYYFLKDMLARDSGKILQLGSEVSKTPMPMMAVYAATKAYVLSFTEALINEIKDTGVTMTLLMPGATDTDFFDKAKMEHTKVYREGPIDPPEKLAEIAFDALLKGKRRLVGPAARKNVAKAAVTPDNVIAKNLRKAMKPSDKESKKTRQRPSHRQSQHIRAKRKVKR